MPGTAAPLDEVKARMAAHIAEREALLLEASHDIHAHPELNFEERHAHDLLTQILEDEGLPVVRHAYGLDTAFAACVGDGDGPTVAVCLEYDALPGIGHACGHNIIASAGLGAGLAAAALAQECGGRVAILGTPAEEGGGGKIFMIRAGAFADVDAAMMVHPAAADLRNMDAIAIQQCICTYSGEAAHAAAAPERGRNALDAAVLGYVNIAALRQHIAPSERIHGVFTDGGDKPNIVPARAQTDWYVRSPTVAGRRRLQERFEACIRAGASAAACEVDIDWIDPPFADLVDNQPLVEAYVANAAGLGRTVRDPAEAGPVVGSTDMGDVSYLVPSIHPMIQAAPPGVPIHTPEFATWAASELGDRAVLDGATAMAWTIADLWLRPELLEAARTEFARRRRPPEG